MEMHYYRKLLRFQDKGLMISNLISPEGGVWLSSSAVRMSGEGHRHEGRAIQDLFDGTHWM